MKLSIFALIPLFAIPSPSFAGSIPFQPSDHRYLYEEFSHPGMKDEEAIKLVYEAKARCDAKFPSLAQAKLAAGSEGRNPVDTKLASKELTNKNIDQFKACVAFYFPQRKVQTYPGLLAAAALVVAGSIATGGVATAADLPLALNIVGSITGFSGTAATGAALAIIIAPANEPELDENARRIFRHIQNTNRIVHEHYRELDEEAAPADEGAAASAQ